MNAVIRNGVLVVSSLVSLTLLGCGGGTPDGPGTGSTLSPASQSGGGEGCAVAKREGTTSCSGYTCQAGQWCDTTKLYDDRCQPGCTSDNNCATGDYCARCPGKAVGVCQACGTAASCQAPQCTKSNFASRQCSQAGLPADGYECEDDLQPTAQNCQQHDLDPGVFCCGSSSSTCTKTPSNDTYCQDTWTSNPPAGPSNYRVAYLCSGNANPVGTCVGERAAPVNGLYCCN